MDSERSPQRAVALFDEHPVLETERLRLRALRPSDANAVLEVFSDPEVLRFYGHVPHRSVDESLDLIRQLVTSFERREAVRWAIARKEDDRLIGSCGLFHFDEGFHRAELGYELHRSFWREGRMTEALTAVLDHAFDRLGLHRVEALVDEPNERPAGLLRKLGFRHEGTLRERFFFGGVFYTDLCFGLLA